MNFELKRKNRPYVGIPLVILFVVLAVLSMRWGIASLDFWKARQAMQQLRTEKITLDARIELVQTALARLDKADSYNPGNPDVMEQRGQFYYWQAMNTANAGHDRGEMPRVCAMIEQDPKPWQCAPYLPDPEET